MCVSKEGGGGVMLFSPTFNKFLKRINHLLKKGRIKINVFNINVLELF
jgi:tRNA A58 N-methylase Trm61